MRKIEYGKINNKNQSREMTVLCEEQREEIHQKSIIVLCEKNETTM